MEDMANGMAVSLDDPVQMLPGRLRIIWHHGGNAPNYRLIITAMGKGQNCLQTGKHACMRFGWVERPGPRLPPIGLHIYVELSCF